MKQIHLKNIELEKLIRNLVLDKLGKKEAFEKTRRWIELFYCSEKIDRGYYLFLRDKLTRLKETNGRFYAVAVDGINDDRVMNIRYPRDNEVEQELKRRLISVGIDVEIINYKG